MQVVNYGFVSHSKGHSCCGSIVELSVCFLLLNFGSYELAALGIELTPSFWYPWYLVTMWHVCAALVFLKGIFMIISVPGDARTL